MKTKLSSLFILLFTVFTFAQTENTLKSIPEFSFVKMQSDGVFSSKDIKKGKQTIIVLFSPTCIHCQLALNHLNNNYDEHLKNTQILLVSEYKADEVLPFLKSNAPKFVDNKNVELLFDSNYEFGPIFQPTSIPTCYLFDKDKNLISRKKGSVEVNQLFKDLK